MASDRDFEALFRTEYPKLLSLGVAMLGRRDVAADLAQEALARAHRRWGDVGDYEIPAAWCRKVMVNLAIDHLRAARSERRAIERLAGGQTFDPPPSPSRWDELVGGLTDRRRLIVTLYYADDWAVDEIADALATSKGAIKAALFKARRDIRRRLDEGDETDG